MVTSTPYHVQVASKECHLKYSISESFKKKIKKKVSNFSIDNNLKIETCSEEEFKNDLESLIINYDSSILIEFFEIFLNYIKESFKNYSELEDNAK